MKHSNLSLYLSYTFPRNYKKLNKKQNTISQVPPDISCDQVEDRGHWGLAHVLFRKHLTHAPNREVFQTNAVELSKYRFINRGFNEQV